MKGQGPRFERETIINFNEEEETASIWTASETTYRRLLKRLGRAYLTEDGERHAIFVFPVKFIDLPRVKAKKVLDPSRRASQAAILAKARKLTGQKGQSGGNSNEA